MVRVYMTVFLPRSGAGDLSVVLFPCSSPFRDRHPRFSSHFVCVLKEHERGSQILADTTRLIVEGTPRPAMVQPRVT